VSPTANEHSFAARVALRSERVVGGRAHRPAPPSYAPTPV